MTSELGDILKRSEALQAAIEKLFQPIDSAGTMRAETVVASCDLATEHACSLRVLIEVGAGSSSIALLRLQYEAVARAMWLTWGATDASIAQLNAPLTTDAEAAANKLPSLGDMLKAVEKHAPQAAAAMLQEFKDVHWKSLNSYVHGGIHPLRRVRDGYPVGLLIQVLQNSNALTTMAAMLFASWTNDDAVIRNVKEFQLQFRDCLPPLKVATTTIN